MGDDARFVQRAHDAAGIGSGRDGDDARGSGMFLRDYEREEGSAECGESEDEGQAGRAASPSVRGVVASLGTARAL
jgi:hypothetical protein